jgi:hypothetical protein
MRKRRRVKSKREERRVLMFRAKTELSSVSVMYPKRLYTTSS